MILNLAKRHWFANEASLSALGEAVSKLERTAELARKYDTDLSIFVSTDGKLISLDMAESAHKHLNSLREAGWKVIYDTNGASATQKYVSHLFQEPNKRNYEVLALCCMDQYPLYEPEYFEAAKNLADKLVFEGNAYANGSRNVPVNLSVNKECSDMRAIHEMIHSLTSGELVFKAEKPSWASPSQSYAEIGESTSGFYFINPLGNDYDFLLDQINGNIELTKKPGFTLEYLTAINAGLAGTVSTGYVYTEKNNFYSSISLEEEKKRITALIQRETTALGRTNAKDALEKVLANGSALTSLESFFPDSLVNEVSDIMRKSLISP